jgi:Kinesin motor domain
LADSFASFVIVFVRLKPSLDEEEDGKKKIKDEKGAWDVKKMGGNDTIVERGVLLKVDGKNSFSVDQVFDEYAQTPFLYKNIARSMVHSVLSGKNATIFAYGETGAG